MKIESLRNYGRPMTEAMAEFPPELARQMKKTSMQILRRELGLIGMARFMLALPGEQRRLMSHDYVVAREHGLTDQAFLHTRIQNAAMFSAMTRVVGEEKALAIQMEISESISYKAMSSMYPTPEDLKVCGDPFDALRRYMTPSMRANREAGVHDFEVVENTRDAFQMNITYCAFYAIPNEVGLGAACLPSCHGDDVFFPQLCPRIGARFARTGTLARGDRVCDFCFERVNRKDEGND